VIYSLTRTLKNNLALKQIPFLGKKTVPAAIRKDLWQPLCLLEFPSSAQGLSIFRKLREFKRLHETAYSLETITETEGRHKGKLLQKKARGKVLMNQKANSIADMAAVLLQQAKPPTEEELAAAERKVRTDGRPLAKRGIGRQATADALRIKGSVEGVRIRWSNILDAEYAETWPKEVVHDGLERHRYTAAWPPAPPLLPAEERDREALNEKKLEDSSEESKKAVETLAVIPETARPGIFARLRR